MTSCIRRFSAAASVLATGVALLLAGCSQMTPAPETNSFESSTTGTLTGHVHGGQQVVYNAAIKLYSAGTSGYGSAGTLLASTTSDVNGNFAFTKLANGSTGSGNSWACAAASPDPQIYILAYGGNTQGTGTTATNNTAAAFLAALGPCSTISTSTSVELNELTTAATVFALGQYINPGTTPGTESIGTNGTNTTTSKPQGALGLNNAVASIVNLVNIPTGGLVTANTYTGTATTVAGVTVTATPESSKLVTIADILASCINQTTAAATTCVDLFTSAAPPPVASVTSQPSATFGTALDTVQAAYYMATNPIDAGTFTACVNTPTATTKVGCLFGLASSTAPYQSPLSSAPTDWTIGVNYTASGACSNSTSSTFLNSPAKEAVDVSGNVWFVEGENAAPVEIGEMSPIGVPLYCGAPTTSYIQGRGLTIDPTGNVWASFDNTGIAEVAAGGTTALAWPTPNAVACSAGSSCAGSTATPTPLTIVSDGNGNIYYTSGSHSTPAIGGLVYEFPSPGTTTTTFKPTLLLSGLGSATSATYQLGYASVDQSSRLWLASQAPYNNGTANQYYVFSATPSAASINGFSINSGNSVNFCTAAATAYTVGQNVVVSGLTSTTGTALNNLGFTITSTTSNSPCTGTGFTGTEIQANALTAGSGSVVADTGTASGLTYNSQNVTTTPYSLPIDSSGYVYTSTSCCATGDSKELLRIAPTNASFTNSAVYLGGTNGGHGMAIDGAGNQWVTDYFPMVGAPGTTPYGNGTYGLTEAYWTGTAFAALSPSGVAPTTPNSCASGAECPDGGGFQKASLLAGTDLVIDPSGNVWAPNSAFYDAGTGTYNGTTLPTYVYYGSGITEVVGAAVPVVTPFSVALKNGTLSTKP